MCLYVNDGQPCVCSGLHVFDLYFIQFILWHLYTLLSSTLPYQKSCKFLLFFVHLLYDNHLI